MQWAQLNGEEYNAISTSRPGIGNPTSAVPTTLYQFEMGINFPAIDTSIAMPMLLRMGIFKNTELQVGYENKYLSLGLLYGGISFINGLENSIILITSLPIPMEGITYKENNDSLIEYRAYLPVSYSFQNSFSISGQISGTFFNINKLDPTISYSLAIGSNLDKKTKWYFEAFPNEIFKLIENEFFFRDENNPFSLIYGLTFISDYNNVQFDLSMGLTLQKKGSMWQTITEENYIEWGLSFRLPK